ncbi:MAG: hypothetical protein ACXWBP_11390 [Limisphaerales bacterium]
MNANDNMADVSQTGALLRGDLPVLVDWTSHWTISRIVSCVATIIIGCGLFGAAIGSWHSPLQALYSGLKLPMVLLLTAVGNALLNGMLAPLLGLNISFRQSLLAILMSFTIAALILGGFSPIIAFLVWNVPPLSSHSTSTLLVYSFIMIVLVTVIAFAGTTANLRLLRLLQSLSTANVGRRILVAWLMVNLFLGAQLSWILRPFIGSPGLPVEFIRGEAFHGTFYEALYYAFKTVIFP